MAGWKFVAEFRRGRKEPIALECFVAVPDLRQAQIIAAKMLVGADEISAEEISSAELGLRNIRNGHAVLV
jgi:hypothetical protein